MFAFPPCTEQSPRERVRDADNDSGLKKPMLVEEQRKRNNISSYGRVHPHLRVSPLFLSQVGKIKTTTLTGLQLGFCLIWDRCFPAPGPSERRLP